MSNPTPNPAVAAKAGRSIPETSLRRLPLYHRFLKQLEAQGRATISCPEIGGQLQLDPTQVRKDLEAAGIAGKPKVGYQIAQVLQELEHFLGWDNVQEAFLVGAGSLGTALLGYTKFEQCGLTIVAAFDSQPDKIGTEVRGKIVLPTEKLPDLAQRMHVHIGIITVPAEHAQAVADLMVQGGIRAIWNFAPVRLVLPAGVIVHNEDLYCSLASLSKRLAEALHDASAATPGAAGAGGAAPPAATSGAV